MEQPVAARLAAIEDASKELGTRIDAADATLADVTERLRVMSLVSCGPFVLRPAFNPGTQRCGNLTACFLEGRGFALHHTSGDGSTEGPYFAHRGLGPLTAPADFRLALHQCLDHVLDGVARANAAVLEFERLAASLR